MKFSVNKNKHEKNNFINLLMKYYDFMEENNSLKIEIIEKEVELKRLKEENFELERHLKKVGK